MKTFIPNIEEVRKNKKWYLIDLQGKTLGRAAGLVANVLRGKNKPIFTPHLDTGDFVIAINAAQVVLSSDKTENKNYYSFSGYPGGLHVRSFDKVMKEKPEFIFAHAVRGMVPKNRLGRKIMKKLHVYAGAEHPHAAQKPEELKIVES